MKNNNAERQIIMEAFHEATGRIICVKEDRNVYSLFEPQSIAQKTYCEYGPFIISVEVPNMDVYRRQLGGTHLERPRVS